jgi:hypothetical protein
MRRFGIIGGEAFCMMAAFFLALSPLAHGLHLASCDHSHGSCNTGHAGYGLSTPFCLQDNDRQTEGGKNHPVAISSSQIHGCFAHDPSTCPICQAFAQLVKGHGLSPAQAEILQQELQLEKPLDGHTISDRMAFFRKYPRAPPAC